MCSRTIVGTNLHHSSKVWNSAEHIPASVPRMKPSVTKALTAFVEQRNSGTRTHTYIGEKINK